MERRRARLRLCHLHGVARENGGPPQSHLVEGTDVDAGTAYLVVHPLSHRIPVDGAPETT